MKKEPKTKPVPQRVKNPSVVSTMNKAAQRHGWDDQMAFTDHLNRLISDLRESGHEATAMDFQTAHDMIVSASLTESL